MWSIWDLFLYMVGSRVQALSSGQIDKANYSFSVKLQCHLQTRWYSHVFLSFFLDSLWMFPQSQCPAFWWQCVLLFSKASLSHSYSWFLEVVEEVGVAWLPSGGMRAAWACWCPSQHLVWGVQWGHGICDDRIRYVAQEELEEMSPCDWSWGVLSSCSLQFRKHLFSNGCLLIGVVPWAGQKPSEGECPSCLIVFVILVSLAIWHRTWSLALGTSAWLLWRRGPSPSLPLIPCVSFYVSLLLSTLWALWTGTLGKFHALGPANGDIGLTSDSNPCLLRASESVGRGQVAVSCLDCRG